LIDPVVDATEHDAIPEFSSQLEDDLVGIFKLLADRMRMRILMSLVREGEMHVSALCQRLDQNQPAVSHHLALLKVAGMIQSRRDGKHNYYSIRKNRFHAILDELFRAMTNHEGDAIRLDEFVLTHEHETE
jgi:ArsR family transcriptional regulator